MPESDIRKKAVELGYDACGIIPAKAFDEYEQYLNERISKFPYSKKFYERFYNFVTLHESAKSIIVCVGGITDYKVPRNLEGLIAKHFLFDNRIPYAYNYRAKEEFEAYLKALELRLIDSPVPMRWSAAKAGLGKFGHNNFIFTKKHGSYIGINAWVVDKVLDYDPMPEDIYLPNCSEKCQKCIKACPTGALSDSFSMDMAKCAARISFSADNILDEEMRGDMGCWIYGCDACQDACPVNKDRFKGEKEFPLLGELEEYFKPENLLTMDEDTYMNIVNPKFFYGGKEGLWRWRVNALRSMINLGKEEYYQLIKDHCNHEDERLRELAQWGCDKLGIL
ncbi:MAG: epoxyqueuosine reductase [Defluviitaleaceae bacterium]|nr:epoxyqueuosine reductase [Defluviitaleaceae bacterium]